MARKARTRKTEKRAGIKTWQLILGLVAVVLVVLGMMATGVIEIKALWLKLSDLFDPIGALSKLVGVTITWTAFFIGIAAAAVSIYAVGYFFTKVKELFLNESEEELERTVKAGPRRKIADKKQGTNVLPFKSEQQELFKEQPQPMEQKPQPFRRNVYEEEEFASFHGGLKKDTSFKNILSFGNKDPYKDATVRKPIEKDPINVPSWSEPESQVYEPSYTDPDKAYMPIMDEPRVYMQSRVNYHMDIKGSEPEAAVEPPEETVISDCSEPPAIINPYHSEEPSSFKNPYHQEDKAEVVEAVVEESKPEVQQIENISVDEEEAAKHDIAIYDSAESIKNPVLENDLQEAAAMQDESKVDEPKAKSKYIFPPVDILNLPVKKDPATYHADIMDQCAILEQTLADFKVRAKVVAVTRGPSVTRFEIEPAPGVKVSSVVNLADDIALRLAAPGVRIEAPIPGKSAIGIEAPNTKTDAVCFRELIESEEVNCSSDKLNIGLGKDISGNIITCNLAKMPHMLVAGSTGSGKSVCINTIIAGLLYKASPEDCKLILVDPKVVELSNYNGIPHLLTPVVTDSKKAASALHWAVAEMERRYQLFADNHVREINSYNILAKEKGYTHLPFIVIIIDELSDLMMVAKVDVEEAILRLAQKARACGIHLVIATQRPSVDVITGIVKANIPSRIAFAVSSLIDSRTILDTGGAEKLLGKGDMLFNPIGQSKPVRVQGAFVSDNELNKIVQFIINQSLPCEYTKEVTEQALSSDPKPEEKTDTGDNQAQEEDPLFVEALELVLDLGQASASMFQRRYRIGYNRAARLVDTMELLGIVGQASGSKPREVIISREEAEEKYLEYFVKK